MISRVLGAAPGPFTVALSTRIRFAFCPAAPAGDRLLVVGAGGGRGAGGDAGDRGDHPAGRGVGYRQGRADLLCAGAQPRQARPAGAGGPDLPDDDPLAAGHGRPAAGVRRDPGGHGGNLGLLEGSLLPAGGPRVRDLAGECPRCQASARAAQDRHAGCGVAVQGRRAADAAPLVRAATTGPAAAGGDPLPDRSGGGEDRGEAASRAGSWRTPRSS